MAAVTRGHTAHSGRLATRLALARRQEKASRSLLLAARAVVGLTLLLVAMNLWRGWRATDYLYLPVLCVWIGLMLIQTRIHARRQTQVADLQRQVRRR